MSQHHWYVLALLGAAVAAGAGGCNNEDETAEAPAASEGTAAAQAPAPGEQEAQEEELEQQPPASPYADVDHAIVVLEPTKGNDTGGTVRLDKVEKGVHVTGTIVGLEPGTKHGFHIHEFGDCSAPDGTSAGGHYNPEGYPHALPPKTPRHAGDMGNVVADDDGKAEVDKTFDLFTIGEERDPVLGRSIIVHAKEDDGGQPTGNAGARIACGVIGIAKSASQ